MPNDYAPAKARQTRKRRLPFLCCFRENDDHDLDRDEIPSHPKIAIEAGPTARRASYRTSSGIPVNQCYDSALVSTTVTGKNLHAQLRDSESRSLTEKSEDGDHSCSPEEVEVTFSQGETEGDGSEKPRGTKLIRSASDPKSCRINQIAEVQVVMPASRPRADGTAEEERRAEDADSEAVVDGAESLPKPTPRSRHERDFDLDLDGTSDGYSPSPGRRSGSLRRRHTDRPNLPRLSLSSSPGSSPPPSGLSKNEKPKRRHTGQAEENSSISPPHTGGRPPPGSSPTNSPPASQDRAVGVTARPARRSSGSSVSTIPRIPLGDSPSSPRTDGTVTRLLGSARARSFGAPLTERTQERRGKLHYAAVAAENEECTFRPQICAKSRRLVAHRKTELELRQRASAALRQQDENRQVLVPTRTDVPPPRHLEYENAGKTRIATSRISVAQLKAALASSLPENGQQARAEVIHVAVGMD
ncbi:hypothetical protein FOZ61_000023 [Perkinsus olseni]|uniref:Uncharacterized protein n=1 Tax=Perkinsus olseni TaxID=32597 RepID=A0A7J6MIJ0_PEROL|nr:hypothetical protein FOZ61_000023 [Perkinsus olseni]